MFLINMPSLSLAVDMTVAVSLPTAVVCERESPEEPEQLWSLFIRDESPGSRLSNGEPSWTVW
jgi:hypothetical protein